jgi:predicted 2-oxoglutarate/Fe(II)-dependent dioxygenase YbiX
MADLATDLSEILKTARRPGDFHVSGAFDLLPPAIDIDGLGPLALPVLPDQAKRLIACAEPAPFGRGQETIVDADVRRSWQIAPERVHVTGKRWEATLQTVVSRVALGLGVSEAVREEFYKLLVYEAGDFFVHHRDTEKSDGMFATLVIALPSISTGGDLVVRHAGRKARLEMRGDDPAEARFAAFYADCVHEVRPVETGCRVTLIYNLIREGAGRKLEPPQHDSEQRAIAELLNSWRRRGDGADAPSPAKIVYPLEHAYTAAEISFGALKGADAAAAGVLASATERAQCDFHLALLTIEQTSAAEYSGGGRSWRDRWREPDEDEFEIGELFNHSQTLTEWRRPDGAVCDFGEMPVMEDEFSPPDVIEDMNPDEQHFHEATGNEGASVERTYKRAALVIWPTAAFLPMMAAAGLSVSLPYLKHVVGVWRITDEDERARLALEAQALAGSMIALWSNERVYGSENEATSTTTFLDLLTMIGAADEIARFLGRTGAGEGRSKSDNRAMIEALAVLAPPTRLSVLGHLIDDSALVCFPVCADLLARAARDWTDLPAAELTTAARRLLALSPSDQSPRSWAPGSRLNHKVVSDLIGAVGAIDPQLANEAVDAMLASPKTYGRDQHLVAALLDLLARPGLSTSPAVIKLRAACVEHLTARIALGLAPPADFRRSSRLSCRCEDCNALARFLDDPVLASWTFKAAAAARSHVETTIRNSECDVDTTTLRRGSPHQLIVTKNQANFERLSRQRREDIENLARMEHRDRP